MVKNNIQIKIGDNLADYDDDTAIALTFNAYNVTDLSSIYLSHSNNFSLPISANNRKIFGFAENTSSNPAIVYTYTNCVIYIDGAEVMRGNIYLENITDRYNCIFTEDKTVFEKLAKIPFISPTKNDTTDSSFCKAVVSYWNSTIRSIINNKYSPTTDTEWGSAVYKYCIERGEQNDKYQYVPANDYCIPFYMNNMMENIPYAPTDGDDEEISTKKNDFWNASTDIAYGYGLNLARAVVYVNSDDSKKREGVFDVSPIWISIEEVIRILQQETGYVFENLADLVNTYTTAPNRLFFHLPGVELDTYFDINEDNNNATLRFNGYLRLVNVGDDDSAKDFHYTSESVSDLAEDNVASQSALDLLKCIMQEFNLNVIIDSANKKLIFRSFDDLLSDVKQYTLVSQDEKYFTLDGLNQKQTIQYENEAAPRIRVTSNNLNIDEGSYDDALLTIDRYYYPTKEYPFIRYKTKKLNVKANDLSDIDEVNTHFVYAIPLSEPKSYTYECTAVSIAGCICWSDNDNGMMRYYLDYGENGTGNLQFQTLIQQDFSTYDVYEKYVKMLENIQCLKVKVRADIKFLANWQSYNIVSIKGLTGKYLVLEVNEYNPRVDTDITMTILKLPNFS